MERLNSANDIDMELFDQYYEPGIEPLTKEEWWDILIRFDDSFTNHTPCKMKNFILHVRTFSKRKSGWKYSSDMIQMMK